MFKGSGGFADELVAERERRESTNADDAVADEDSDEERQENVETKRIDSTIDEILSFGKIYVIDLRVDNVEDVTSLCFSRMDCGSQGGAFNDPVLFDAWRSYAQFKMTARYCTIHQEFVHLSAN